MCKAARRLCRDAYCGCCSAIGLKGPVAAGAVTLLLRERSPQWYYHGHHRSNNDNDNKHCAWKWLALVTH